MSGAWRMAQSLSRQVIAERVENSEQRNHLRDLACVLMQGYRFSRAQTVERMGEVLKSPWFSNCESIGLERVMGMLGSTLPRPRKTPRRVMAHGHDVQAPDGA